MIDFYVSIRLLVSISFLMLSLLPISVCDIQFIFSLVNIEDEDKSRVSNFDCEKKKQK